MNFEHPFPRNGDTSPDTPPEGRGNGANGTSPPDSTGRSGRGDKLAGSGKDLRDGSSPAIWRKAIALPGRVRRLFGSSLRAKILLPVVGCLVLAVAVTFFVVERELARQFDRDARRTLVAADEVVRYSQQFRRNDLLLRFHTLPQVPLWNQVFQSAAPKDLHETLLTLMDMQKVDVVFYASKRGKILDVVNNATVPQTDFESTAAAALQLALDGTEQADTVRVAGKVYDVFAIPAYDPSGKQIGALVLGSGLGVLAAKEFSQMTRCAVALVSHGYVIASTLPGLETNVPFAAEFGRALPDNDESAGDVKAITLNGQQYYGISGSFESLNGASTVGYVLLSSREQGLAEQAAAQHLLTSVGVLAVVFGALAVWFFIYKAMIPLRELRQGAEAVERGEFSRRVPVRSGDESGQLALVFNEMMESVEESRARLEENVEQLKITQEQLREQLVFSERLSAIGEFVAGVAHELNNPLAAVVGFSELLKKGPDVPNRAHYYDIIFKSALRCKKVVQSLLSFARRDKPKREPVGINGLVESVLDLVGYALRKSNIQVITHLAPDLPSVLADANQIQQVLLNIVTNAQHALEGRQAGGQIKITTEFREPNVRVTIEDNGPGIPPEVMPRLFDPFFTTKEAGKGTGLGLSLCQGFIKEHGGSITPVSESGKGASFVVELPASAQSAAQADTAAPDEKLQSDRGKGKRVLVVDDEQPILLLVQEALGAQGYEVKVAANGEQALAEFKVDSFDLAICDWKMPGMSGREVYEHLQAINPKLCQRMVFITGDVVNPEMRKFLEREKRPCLAKPFTLPEFHAAIEGVLAAK